METTTLTIRNVPIDDKGFLIDRAILLDIPVAQVFTQWVSIVKTAVKTEPETVKTAEKTSQTDETSAKLAENAALIKELNEKLATAEAKLADLSDQLETLKNQEPKEVEKIIEKEVKLPDFICQPDETLVYQMRLIRNFAVKDGLVKLENPSDYPNELAKLAIRQLIKREYPDHIYR